MKNKIIAIGVICSFLLMTISSFSVLAEKTNILNENKKDNCNNEQLPDLTIKIEFDRGDDPPLDIKMDVLIYNKGTVSIPRGTEFLWVIYDSNGEWVLTECITLDFKLMPGSHITRHNSNFNVISDFGREFIVIVDPTDEKLYERCEELNPDPEYGVIKELNETNNFYKAKVPKLKSYHNILIKLTLLERLFHLPLFAGLLEL